MSLEGLRRVVKRETTVKSSLIHAEIGTLALLIVFIIGAIDLEGRPPLSWDEGWTLCVARNWIVLGHYGCLLSGQPAPPTLAGHFPVVAPVALSFRLFGIGIWQGRVVGLLLTAGALVLLYYFTAKLYNRSVAVGALVILLLLPVMWELHPVIIGRQVLGEMPMLFYLLAGYTCFLLTQQKPLLFMPLALGFWGIALMAKAQVAPFWAASLIAPLTVMLFKRRWRSASWLVVGLFGSWGVSRMLTWGIQLLLAEHRLPTAPLSGLIDVTAFVPVISVRLSILRYTLTFGLPTLLGLGYALRRWMLSQRTSDPENISNIVRLMLLTLAAALRPDQRL
ncbi:MAG: glycosyltransferase family 39 protein [Chloroflexi bacterium]|nr:glycosyltransferase family 39 protein [Chloroflexota bacterium]